jgi:hypothetical protein
MTPDHGSSSASVHQVYPGTGQPWLQRSITHSLVHPDYSYIKPTHNKQLHISDFSLEMFIDKFRKPVALKIC